MNVGVFGGTFDPPHHGHLQVAEEVRRELDLARIIFVPAGQPYFKEALNVLPAHRRLEMVSLAVRGKPYFQLSTLEADRPGRSYTVDTLSQLRDLLNGGDELFFILSWGSLAELSRWREPSRIIEFCKLVVVPRPGYLPPDLKALESQIPGLSKRLIMMAKPRIDISASEIRRRVAQGLPISHLVPEVVAKYIKFHRLYLLEG